MPMVRILGVVLSRQEQNVKKPTHGFPVAQGNVYHLNATTTPRILKDARKNFAHASKVPGLIIIQLNRNATFVNTSLLCHPGHQKLQS
jgi:hypothetical protein